LTATRPTAAELVAVVVTVGETVTTPDTQLTGRTQADSSAARVARAAVAFVAQVRTVEDAVTAPCHVNTRTTATSKLPLTARCIAPTTHMPRMHLTHTATVIAASSQLAE